MRNLLIYGGVIINGAVVGSILYANHNPSFKRLADSYVPGFEVLVDESTAIWNTGQTVFEEWWKKIKGMSSVNDKEEKTETSNKQNEHILLAIKKTVEEEATRKAENKMTPEKTSQSHSKKATKPEATQPSSNQPSGSSDKNDKQTPPSKQEKHTAAAAQTTKSSLVSSSQPPASSDKNDQEAVPQEKAAKTNPVTQPPASSDKNDKQASPQEKRTAAKTSSVSEPSLASSSQPPASRDKKAASQEKHTVAAKTSSSSKTSNAPAQTTAAVPASSNSSAPSTADTSDPPPNEITTPPLSKAEVTDKSASTSEAGDLSRVYNQFAAKSDLLLSSQQELAQAIAVHHLQQQEATKAPMSEEQRKTIAGKI